MVLSAWAVLVFECCYPLKHPLLLSKFIKDQFSLIKMVSFLFIPFRSLTCYKSNLFRRTCDFPVGWTTNVDLQWKVSHYLKGLLWLNIKRNKIANILQTRLNVLTNFFFDINLHANKLLIQRCLNVVHPLINLCVGVILITKEIF